MPDSQVEAMCRASRCRGRKDPPPCTHPGPTLARMSVPVEVSRSSDLVAKPGLRARSLSQKAIVSNSNDRLCRSAAEFRLLHRRPFKEPASYLGPSRPQSSQPKNRRRFPPTRPHDTAAIGPRKCERSSRPRETWRWRTGSAAPIAVGNTPPVRRRSHPQPAAIVRRADGNRLHAATREILRVGHHAKAPRWPWLHVCANPQPFIGHLVYLGPAKPARRAARQTGGMQAQRSFISAECQNGAISSRISRALRFHRTNRLRTVNGLVI